MESEFRKRGVKTFQGLIWLDPNVVWVLFLKKSFQMRPELFDSSCLISLAEMRRLKQPEW